MIYITRKFHFSASHKVFNSAWSDAENFDVYGKCSNPNGHGHNYILEVTLKGEIDPAIGYVMDLKELNTLVDKILIQKIDHKNLNVDVDFLHGIIPTTENIVVQFWKQLEGKVRTENRELYSLKLYETEKNFVEYRG